MAWLRSEQSLAAHPKTKRVARTLGLSIPTVVGHLHCLWYWALDYAKDGDLSGYEAWEISEAALYGGDPEAFIEALATCGGDGAGFLEFNGKKRIIHDWYDYAGKLIEQREANTERMRHKRAEHVQDTCGACAGATNERTNVTNERTSPPVDNLLRLCLQELPKSESTEEDYARTLERYRAKLSDEHIERVIVGLGNWTPKTPRKKWHLTLAKCLSGEPRDPIPPAHAPPELNDNEEGAVPMPEDVKQLIAGIGRTI